MIIKVAIAQIQVIPAMPEANLKKAETLIAEAAHRGSTLICLPEMWTTGFQWDYIDVKYMEQKPIIERVKALAAKYGIWLNCSLLSTNEQLNPTNTSLLIDPLGEIRAYYHKTHLFRPIKEDKHLEAGNSLVLTETPWGKMGMSICYDLRFPELYRSYALQGADIILLNAAFPRTRALHWKTLIRARAIENQLFVIAVNQTGIEAGVELCGSSAIIDPWGETLLEAPENQEALLTVDLDMDRVKEVRAGFNTLSDRRPEVYKLG